MKAVRWIKFDPEEYEEFIPPNMSLFSDVSEIKQFHIDLLYEAAEYARSLIYEWL